MVLDGLLLKLVAKQATTAITAIADVLDLKHTHVERVLGSLKRRAHPRIDRRASCFQLTVGGLEDAANPDGAHGGLACRLPLLGFPPPLWTMLRDETESRQLEDRGGEKVRDQLNDLPSHLQRAIRDVSNFAAATQIPPPDSAAPVPIPDVLITSSTMNVTTIGQVTMCRAL